MTKRSSMSTRVAADVVAAASAVAPAEHRSTAEQINHWARLGMQIERSDTLLTRHALEVAAGRAQFSTLAETERRAAHALVDARIAERAAGERFGAAARSAGLTTVALDDDGRLVEIGPDGAHLGR